MRSPKSWFAAVLCAGLIACSSSDTGTGAGSKKGESCAKSADCAHALKCISQECVPDLAAGFCQQYADLCGGDSASVSDCESKCFDTVSASSDDCWFTACGVLVGKCDNQEPNDTSIEACATQHGWN
jgi:hypothetical protein